MPEDRPITGDDIITELVRNLHEGQFRVRYTTLVPSIYRVYLHEQDYEALRPVLSFLTSEAGRALEEAVEEMNRKAQPSAMARQLGFGQKSVMEYKSLSRAFAIEFYSDQNGELERGEIEIHSELGAPPKADLGLGEMTRLITKRAPTGESSSRQERIGGDTEERTAPANALARIRFDDRTGSHTYEITKDLIVIGRGGKTYWVDVKLDTEPDVSREHCRIRRDPDSGRFYIKDVSQFGTSVNGKPAPSSLERAGGAERDKNIEMELPRRARIGLAEMVFLEFEALQ